jgi:hypothetical protein
MFFPTSTKIPEFWRTGASLFNFPCPWLIGAEKFAVNFKSTWPCLSASLRVPAYRRSLLTWRPHSCLPCRRWSLPAAPGLGRFRSDTAATCSLPTEPTTPLSLVLHHHLAAAGALTVCCPTPWSSSVPRVPHCRVFLSFFCCVWSNPPHFAAEPSWTMPNRCHSRASSSPPFGVATLNTLHQHHASPLTPRSFVGCHCPDAGKPPLLEKWSIVTHWIHYWYQMVTVADTNIDELTSRYQ